jgi:competence protein ComEC
VRASVLSPEAGYSNPDTAKNDDSLVVRLAYGKGSVLLEGDAEWASEVDMLLQHRVARSTLLKVGHHGSKTSTAPAFLAAVSPREAVISVGKHNTFGHPRWEVLDRLERAHVQTWRTDREGAETFLITRGGGISELSAASNP